MCLPHPGLSEQALADQWSQGYGYTILELNVSLAGGEWTESDWLLLNLWMPVLGDFSFCSGRELYFSCVRILDLCLLIGINELRWTEVFGSEVSLKPLEGLCISPLLKSGWVTSSGGPYMEQQLQTDTVLTDPITGVSYVFCSQIGGSF